MTKKYPSDVSDAEWRVLEPLLPKAKKPGRPRTVDRRWIVNALMYVLRSGCSWRMLPHDFPVWQTVYNTFRRWRRMGVFARWNRVLREQLRYQQGQERTPTVGIVDSQSVRTTEKGALLAATTARNA